MLQMFLRAFVTIESSIVMSPENKNSDHKPLDYTILLKPFGKRSVAIFLHSVEHEDCFSYCFEK